MISKAKIFKYKRFNSSNKKIYDDGGLKFTCTSCGFDTYLDESYSNSGLTVICRNCVSKWSTKLKINPIKFVKKYVWEEVNGNKRLFG